MLENSERYPLQHILVEDIFPSNKLIVVLLLLILASAMGNNLDDPPNKRLDF